MAPVWWTRTLAGGDHGRDVAIVQSILGEFITGKYDPALTLVIRGFQKGAGLPVTGAVDARTAAALGEQAGFGLLPTWWHGTSIGPDSVAYDHCLRLIGAEDELGMRRFQGAHRITPTGVVDETTARLLAGLEVDT